MGGRYSSIAATVLIVLASAGLRAADPPPTVRLPEGKDTHTIPLTRGGEYLFVHCKVNAQEAGWFLVDTGANRLVLDKALAERLKLPRLGGGQINVGGGTKRMDASLFEIEQLEFAGITAGRQIVTVTNLASMPMLGDKVVGVLGTEILRELPFTLDYRSCTLTFHASAKALDSATEHIKEEPIRVVNGIPALRASVEGRPGWFLFDSGANGSFDLYQAFTNLNREMLTGKHIVRRIGFGLGGVATARGTTFDSFTVAGRTFEKQPGTYLETTTGLSEEADYTCAGLLGSQLFADARMTFDFARSKAWVEWQVREDAPAYVRRIERELKADIVGTKPLIRAAGERRADAVKQLVETGADVNAAGMGGATPLMLCANDAELVKLLLSKGADPNTMAAIKADTALLRAAENGNVESIRLLLAAGAKVDHANTLGQTPLYLAAEGNWPDAIGALLEGKASVDKATKEGETPLFIACRFERAEAIAALLKGNPDTETRATTDGATALMVAAATGSVEAVESLLKAGAKINYQDPRGRSALMIAAYFRRASVARALLLAGADRTLKTTDGKTAWDVGVDRGAVDVLRVLKYELPAPANPG